MAYESYLQKKEVRRNKDLHKERTTPNISTKQATITPTPTQLYADAKDAENAFKIPKGEIPTSFDPIQAFGLDTSSFTDKDNRGYLPAYKPPIQRVENKTGLPDNLKLGVENLSGMSMDDVNVHYNSSKPTQLQAHAYAQGTDIHLASGQEKHLPHEAWHVVQQKQGRVKPTMQMKGVSVNDDHGLESEADVMGVIALQKKEMNPKKMNQGNFSNISVTQFNGDFEDKANTLILKLKKSVDFVKEESKGEVQKVISNLDKAPTDLDELEEIANLGNQIYAQFDHKLKEDSKEAWEEGGYRKKLSDWAVETQLLVYELRDILLMKDPSQLNRYSLEEQYKKKFDKTTAPSALVEVDKTLGTVIFSKEVGNDCGRFANALFSQRMKGIAKNFIEEKHDTEGMVSEEEMVEFMKNPEVASAKHAKLNYYKSSEFPYPHHAKTSIAESGEKIYTLEAHKGKPFLLAPELQEYGSTDAFLENTDEYIESRETKDFKGEIEKLGLSGINAKARYEILNKFSEFGEQDVPLGKTPKDFSEKREKPKEEVEVNTALWDKLGGEEKRKCFITTACVTSKGLTDDCYELTTLRDFRDTFMRQREEGDELIRLYYKIAPTIVERINQQKNKMQIYNDLYDVVVYCVLQIKAQNNLNALKKYSQMVEQLSMKYLTENEWISFGITPSPPNSLLPPNHALHF